MSAPEIENKDENKMQVEVKVNRNEEIEDLKKRLDAEKKLREDAEAKKKEAEDAKKSAEDVAEDLKSKMDAVAEAEFVRRKSALVEKVRSSVPDPARAKEVEDTILTPEDLKRVEYMLTQLDAQRIAMMAEIQKAKDEATTKGKEADDAKKAKEDIEKKLEGVSAPTGTAPLNPSVGGVAPQKGGYESYAVMVKDLRERERKGDQEAKAILDALFKKWVESCKKDFRKAMDSGSSEGIEKKTLKEETGKA